MNARRQAIKELLANGYVLKRQCGGHDIYYNKRLKYSIPLKRSFDDEDLKQIRREISKGSR